MHVVCNSCYPRTKTVYILGFPTEKNVGSCVFPFRFSKVGFHSCIFYSSPSFFVFVKIRKCSRASVGGWTLIIFHI